MRERFVKALSTCRRNSRRMANCLFRRRIDTRNGRSARRAMNYRANDEFTFSSSASVDAREVAQ